MYSIFYIFIYFPTYNTILSSSLSPPFSPLIFSFSYQLSPQSLSSAFSFLLLPFLSCLLLLILSLGPHAGIWVTHYSFAIVVQSLSRVWLTAHSLLLSSVSFIPLFFSLFSDIFAYPFIYSSFSFPIPFFYSSLLATFLKFSMGILIHVYHCQKIAIV